MRERATSKESENIRRLDANLDSRHSTDRQWEREMAHATLTQMHPGDVYACERSLCAELPRV